MEWVKTTAKTLPEAIDLALDNLGVDESEAEIVVLEEPRQGLFGRMRGTARVEARVKPKAIRPKTERNRNRRSKSEGGSRSKGGNDRGKNRSRNRSAGQSGNRNSGNRDGGRSDQGGRSGSDKDRTDDRETSSRGSGEGSRSRNSGRGASGGNKDRSRQDGDQQRSKGRNNNRDNDTKPKEETPVEEVAAHLQTFLSGLTEAFGFDSEVTVDSSEPDVLVGRIEGQHGLLVGPKGRTLDAVQELARISCQRTVPSSIRIKVDVGGYRQQRVEALGAFARKAADTAVETGDEVALEPMSAADRKAIHDAISDDDRVETRSVGTEPRRKVLVVPVAEEEIEEDDHQDDASDNGASDDAPAAEADADSGSDDGDLVEAGDSADSDD